MHFEQAYDPFRTLGVSWKLLWKGPVTLFLGGFLLILAGSLGGGVDFHYSAEDWDWSESPELSALWAMLIAYLSLVGCVLGILAWLFRCLLWIGMGTAVERVLREGKDEAGDLFKPRDRWFGVVVATLLRGLIQILVTLPLIGIVLVAGFFGREVFGDGGAVGAVLVCVLAYLPVLIYVSLGLSLTYEAAAIEGLFGMDAVRRSWALASGHRLQLLIYHVVLGVVGFVGVFACCIGVILTGTWATTGYVESYLRMIRSPEEQEPWELTLAG